MSDAIPERIRIDHDDHHAKHVGRTNTGQQFFLTTPFVPALGSDAGCEFVALFLFDSSGKCTSAEIDDLGPRAALDDNLADQIYNNRLASLGDVVFCDIEIEPFAIERHGMQFGLIPRFPDAGDDEDYLTLEMHPGNYMAFFDPWDGEYDT